MKYLAGHPCIMPLLAAFECAEYHLLVMPLVGHDLFVAVEHGGASGPDSLLPLSAEEAHIHTRQLLEGAVHAVAAC